MLLPNRSIWNSVVGDLLQISPNHQLQQQASNMTGEELRALAIRFFSGCSHLSVRDPMRIPAITHRMSRNVKQIELIPGAPFLFGLSDQGVFHLFDAHTGTELAVWEPPFIGCKATCTFSGSVEDQKCAVIVSCVRKDTGYVADLQDAS
jgi:hypothetical protein